MSYRKYKIKPVVSLLATSFLIFNTAISFAASPEISLDDSVAMALKNNPSIQMALADKEKALWGIKENEAGRLPTLSLSSGYSLSPDSSSANLGSSSANESFNNSIKLNLPLYTGGRVEGQIDQAKLNADVADLGVTKAEQQLKLDTTTSYYDVLQGRNVVKVNQETVNNLSEHLKNVQAQYKVGTIAKLDVLRSEVELANAQQNLTKAQNAYDVAVASFNNVTGMPLDSQTIMKDDLTYVKYDMSLGDSIKLAQQKRPEIAQSKDNIDIAKAGSKIADSGRLPTVAVSGNEGISGPSFPGENSNWSVGVAASWNVFDAGVTNSKVKEAKANEAKVIAGDKQTRDGIELEVRQAYLSMKEAEARMATSQVAVSQGTEGLKASEAKYYAGAGTNMDVIDAQMALTQANTNATQATYDYNVNRAKLEKANGL